MKDQQIDALALYKAYYRFLQEEPRDTAGDLRETNPHRINIRHFENMVGREKENFLGQYRYAKHIGYVAEHMRVMVACFRHALPKSWATHSLTSRYSSCCSWSIRSITFDGLE